MLKIKIFLQIPKICDRKNALEAISYLPKKSKFYTKMVSKISKLFVPLTTKIFKHFTSAILINKQISFLHETQKICLWTKLEYTKF